MANGAIYQYPGLSMKGVTDPSVIEMVTQFSAHALGALQTPGEETNIKWAEGLAHSNPAQLGDEILKVPIDLSRLDGFKEWSGQRQFRDTNLSAIALSSRHFDDSVAIDVNKAKRGLFGSWPEKGAELVQTGRRTLPRLIADLLKNGKAATTECFDGQPLFSTTHKIDPFGKAVAANQQSNYKAAYGKFSPATFKSGRTLMRQMRGLLPEPLGLTPSLVIGPTHMEDAFEETLDPMKIIAANAAGTAADSLLTRGKCPWALCSQLDTDKYITDNPGKHLWFMVSFSLMNIRPFESLETNGGVPEIKILGEESEFCALHNKVAVVADQYTAVAPAFYMTIIRFEET